MFLSTQLCLVRPTCVEWLGVYFSFEYGLKNKHLVRECGKAAELALIITEECDCCCCRLNVNKVECCIRVRMKRLIVEI